MDAQSARLQPRGEHHTLLSLSNTVPVSEIIAQYDGTFPDSFDNDDLIALVLQSGYGRQGYNNFLAGIRRRYDELDGTPEASRRIWLYGKAVRRADETIDFTVRSPAHDPRYSVHVRRGTEILRPVANFLAWTQKYTVPIGIAGKVLLTDDSVITVKPEAFWFDKGDTAHVLAGGAKRAYTIGK